VHENACPGKSGTTVPVFTVQIRAASRIAPLGFESVHEKRRDEMLPKSKILEKHLDDFSEHDALGALSS
jgi:hypothetical protein